MRVLLCLAEQAGSIVSRETLLDTVWGEVVVNEDALTRAISDLRKCFDDRPSAPQYIETVRGQGYRLVAPVTFPKPDIAHLTPTLSGDGQEANLLTVTPSPPIVPQRRWPPALSLATVVVLVLGMLWMLWPTPATPPFVQATPFTSFPGYERAPALSPDGTQVVYGWGDDYWEEEFDLYLKQSNTETPLRLTDLPGLESEPAWAPDGRTIAFAHLQPQADGGYTAGIYTVPAIGGPPRKLIDTNSWVWGLDWSPDGTSLVYAERGAADLAFGLYHLSLQNLTRTALTEATVPLQRDHLPVYSPDGRQIAFLRLLPSGLKSIYTMPSDGGIPRPLQTPHTRIEALTWHSDGDHLIYATAQTGISSLWQIPVAGGAPTLLPTNGRGIVDLSMARTMYQLVFEETLAEVDIWRIQRQHHADTTATATPFIQSTQWDGEAIFSPNGTTLAFISSRSGNQELWLATADGTDLVQLTHFGGSGVSRPRWSPNGEQIAVLVEADGQSNIYLVPTAGGMPHRLPHGDDLVRLASWSRDGQWIYFSSDHSGTWQLWKLPITGGSPIQVTTMGGFDGYESHNRQHLLYTRADTMGLWQLPLAGGPPQQLLPTFYPWQAENWHVHETGLFYIDFTPQGPSVVCYAFDSGVRERIAVLPRRRTIYHLTISPDARTILFTHEHLTGSDLYTIDFSIR